MTNVLNLFGYLALKFLYTDIMLIYDIPVFVEIFVYALKNFNVFFILEVIGTLKQYINQIKFLKIHFRMTLQDIRPIDKFINL